MAAQTGAPPQLEIETRLFIGGEFVGVIADTPIPFEHWTRIFGVNVLGVVHGCYYFLPKMIAAGGARQVVIIASGAAHFPPPNAGACS